MNLLFLVHKFKQLENYYNVANVVNMAVVKGKSCSRYKWYNHNICLYNYDYYLFYQLLYNIHVAILYNFNIYFTLLICV